MWFFVHFYDMITWHQLSSTSTSHDSIHCIPFVQHMFASGDVLGPSSGVDAAVEQGEACLNKKYEELSCLVTSSQSLQSTSINKSFCSTFGCPRGCNRLAGCSLRSSFCVSSLRANVWLQKCLLGNFCRMISWYFTIPRDLKSTTSSDATKKESNLPVPFWSSYIFLYCGIDASQKLIQ